jgi:hypothetical protein
MTQDEIILSALKEYGFVSRNWAIKNYITRLGAIMNRLKKRGIEFTAEYEKTSNGQDYVYRIKEVNKSVNKPDLNERLKEILKSINPSWDNALKIQEITNALKSNNTYLKTEVIKKYETNLHSGNNLNNR